MKKSLDNKGWKFRKTICFGHTTFILRCLRSIGYILRRPMHISHLLNNVLYSINSKEGQLRSGASDFGHLKSPEIHEVRWGEKGVAPVTFRNGIGSRGLGISCLNRQLSLSNQQWLELLEPLKK